MRLALTPTRAFTLSELLVSLAILGLLATFAVPKVLPAANRTLYLSIFQ